MSLTSLALLQLGGGEIIVILVLLFVLGVMAIGVVGVIYLIVRAAQKQPASVPLTLPPEVWIESQRKRDCEHLKLLSIFHFIFAGLALLGIGFIFVHYAFMHMVFSNPEMWKTQRGAEPPPKEFLDAFIWFYVFGGFILFLGLVLNVVSGVFLQQRQHRMFSLVTGGLNCLQIPFGTALGVFTIIVLSRESVRELYSGVAA